VIAVLVNMDFLNFICKNLSELFAVVSVSSTSHAGCHLVDRLLRLSEGFRQGIDVMLRFCTDSQSSVQSEFIEVISPNVSLYFRKHGIKT
jgi:hypothetical protein